MIVHEGGGVFSLHYGIFWMIFHTSSRNSTKESKAWRNGKHSKTNHEEHKGCFMVVTRSFSIFPANIQQSMRGAKCSKLQSALRAK